MIPTILEMNGEKKDKFTSAENHKAEIMGNYNFLGLWIKITRIDSSKSSKHAKIIK